LGWFAPKLSTTICSAGTFHSIWGWGRPAPKETLKRESLNVPVAAAKVLLWVVVVDKIAGYDSSEVECTAHVCLCPFVLSVDMDKN